MTTWQPDTCDCNIEYDNNTQWLTTIKKCRLHNNLDNQNLLDSILAQNRRFNLAFGSIILTKEQEDLINQSKAVNKLRIKKEDLINFDEHLPTEKTLGFFSNLRKFLRL